MAQIGEYVTARNYREGREIRGVLVFICSQTNTIKVEEEEGPSFICHPEVTVIPDEELTPGERERAHTVRRHMSLDHLPIG